MSRKLIILIFTLLIVLTACSKPQPSVPEEHKPSVQTPSDEKREDFIGVWISYIEITESCDSQAEFISCMNEMFSNFSLIGVTDVFFHVRPFGDALYPSELFP